MKSLFVIFIFITQVSYAQNVRGPCGDSTKNTFILNGIMFFPKDKESNRSESTLIRCKNFQSIYSLDGLEISEKQFLKLNISNKHVSKNKAYYKYYFKNNDTTNCINTVKLYINLSIPMRLNGTKLKPSEKDKALKGLSSEKIIFIDRKKYFFIKSIIEIKTE